MAMMNCEKHGWTGADRVSRGLLELVQAASAAAHVVDITLVHEGLEFPVMIDRSEIEEVERLLSARVDADGIIAVIDESLIETFLGTLTVACTTCLRELRAGAIDSSS